MAVYYGVVHDHTVILPADADIDDGATVEVRVMPRDHAQLPDDVAEDLFKLELQRRGLLREIKPRLQAPPTGDRTPVKVEGKPLSEMIIEDRR